MDESVNQQTTPPVKLGGRARSRLAIRLGVADGDVTPEAVRALGEQELLKIKGLGRKTLHEVRLWMREAGELLDGDNVRIYIGKNRTLQRIRVGDVVSRVDGDHIWLAPGR